MYKIAALREVKAEIMSIFSLSLLILGIERKKLLQH